MAEKKDSKLRYSSKFKLIIGIITVVLIALMFPKGESIESKVSVGSIWIHSDLIAQFTFPVLKDPKVYKKELKTAEESVYPVFLKKEGRILMIMDSLKRYDGFVLKIIDSVLNVDSLQNLNPTFLTTQSFITLENMRKYDQFMLPSKTIPVKIFFTKVRDILRNIYKKGIINKPPEKELKDSISIRVGNVDRIIPIKDMLNVEEAKQKVQNEIIQLGYPLNVDSLMVEYTTHFIVPDILYSRDLTQQEINHAKILVSKYSGIVNKNERIIAKHDRITKETKLKIESYKISKGEKLGSDSYYLQFLGKILHIAFLLSLLTIYLFLFRKKIYNDNLKIIILSINFIFLSFITFLINQVSINAPIQFLIFIPASVMLLTIIFDSRVGFYCTVIIVLITGALRGNDYTFAVMNLFAGALSVYSVRDIKNRSQIFRSFLFILIGYIVVILAFGLERFATPESILIETSFAGFNALISPALTYGLLIFFEKLFKITTDLTLLELSNFDRPLLKELARRAPGTFNHSMTVGTLAETAAENIGANTMLARVGPYYHDIGKTITPQNFVENQLNNQNIHENLTPEESVNLIIKHVKDGIILAEENDLPQEIIDFIPMHHGTTTISFFYEKAKKLYGDEKVDINDYKYPGPKPNTKETAIVMLADGCESAVRSIEDADPVKVKNVIDKVIQSRIDGGQLDDSPITFSDISKIKKTFVGILLGQHHKRIRYPKQDEVEKGIGTKGDEK